VAPADIHWVKVDRISGKRVFTGSPTDDPKSSVIWEAFKAESEARPGIGTEELEKQRAALINAIKRGSERSSEDSAADSAGDSAGSPTIVTDTGP
jgi:penicillin-binding protein 1A